MKKTICTLLAGLSWGLNVFADPGTIHFFNSPTTRVSLYHVILGDLGFTSITPGGFKYQLFIAPAGTTDPLQFLPTNVTGTNLTSVGAAGRFFGGSFLEVNGVNAGETRSILIRGWSTSLGNDYAEARNNWDPFFNGFLGESAIAPCFQFGGDTGEGIIPTSPIYSGLFGIQTGFAQVGVPEPATGTLIGLGLAALSVAQRRRQAC